ncbi:MAG: SDR family oxidoreductase [Pseudomonadales bacterium]|nr:SDR family oxidoreductase [Pseudomonadales bacterium]
MKIDLSDRAAIVSGGGRGIGRAVSLTLASYGASVVVNYRVDSRAADATVNEIRDAGGEAVAIQADVSDFEEVSELVKQAEGLYSAIGILVNNAGMPSRGLSVADTDPRELVRVMNTHANGAHYLSKLVIPKMRALDRGDIVMISSAATKGLSAKGAPYNMSKAAVEALASTLYKEERENGIRVNTVAPGLVETEMGRRFVRASTGIVNMRDLDSVMPFGHVCQPQDIADLVAFLVSDANVYITGERIYCDGGGEISTY